MTASDGHPVGNEASIQLVWPRKAMPPEVAARIEAIRDVLTETERPAERERRLPLAAVEAMAGAGLFAMSLPGELGGWEADPILEMEVVEAVARASTSAAWCLMVGSLHSAYPAFLCSDKGVKAVFQRSALSIVPGQMAPVGQTRAVPTGMILIGLSAG